MLNSTIHSSLSALIGWRKSLSFILSVHYITHQRRGFVSNATACFLTWASCLWFVSWSERNSNLLITTKRYDHIWAGEVWDNTSIIIKLQFSRLNCSHGDTDQHLDSTQWCQSFRILDTRCYAKYFTLHDVLMQIKWTWYNDTSWSPSYPHLRWPHVATLSNIPI